MSSLSPSPNTPVLFTATTLSPMPQPQELRQLMQDILTNKQSQPEPNDDDEEEVAFKLTPEHIERARKFGIINIDATLAVKTGWLQNNANIHRNRMADLTTRQELNTYHNKYANMKLIPNSIINPYTGISNWIVPIENISKQTQLLYDYSSNNPLLYVYYTNGLLAINPSTGVVQQSSNRYINNYSLNQNILIVGKSFIAVPNKSKMNGRDYNRIDVFDKNNLSGHVNSIVLQNRKGELLNLDKCSNILASSDININSLFMSCQNTDQSYTIFKYDVNNTTGIVHLETEINLNSLFGLPPKVCPNQLISYGKNMIAVSCDVGLITFYQENLNAFRPRIEINTQITPETQMFGTLRKVALFTVLNDSTMIDFVDAQ